MSDKILTTCTYCSCGCGMYLTPDMDKKEIIEVVPSPSHPINNGSLCFRGWKIHEFINSKNRLKKPLIRKNGELKETGWDEALEIVSSRLKEIKEKHSSDSIGIIGSAKCTNEDNYLLYKFGLSCMGTNNIDTSIRLYQTAIIKDIENIIGLSTVVSREDIDEAALKRLYDAVPSPKLVFAIGACASRGSIWKNTYNVIGGVDNVLPVNLYVPGCPPRPEAILHGVAVALGLAPKQVAKEEFADQPLSELFPE